MFPTVRWIMPKGLLAMCLTVLSGSAAVACENGVYAGPEGQRVVINNRAYEGAPPQMASRVR